MIGWWQTQRTRRAACALVTAGAALSLGGCEIFGFLAGHGKQEALYRLPEGAKVLVLVDVRPELAAPPTWGTMLGDRISSHLYRHKAADNLVGQDRLVDLQRDPVAFNKMGVADIAVATEADVVLVVDVVDMGVVESTDGGMTQGAARVAVKVVDKAGNRLWPGELAGKKLEARVNPVMSTDKDKTAVYKDLADQLTLLTARMFHEYDLEDKSMIKSSTGERI